MALAADLRAAEAEVLRIKRAIGAATCAQIGEHDMKSIGGSNAGCCDTCTCSVPVHVCTRCEECDYGDNAFAKETRRLCELRNGPPPRTGGDLNE